MKTTLDLYSILEDAGITALREGSKEISGHCPGHMERLGKPDTHSSWSINRFSFLHHCFSCGYSGTLTGLLVDTLGYAPENLEEELGKSSFLNSMAKVTEREAKKEEQPEGPHIDEWTLSHAMQSVPQRLVDFRRLQRKAVEEYGVRWDTERKAWVLPVRTPTGVLLGAQFRQKGNELNLPAGLEKSQAVFGLSEMKRYDTVALVESPLDAVRMYGVGIPAVSSFGAWVSREQCRLLARNFSNVVLALDNDSAGRKGAAKVAISLKWLKVASTRFQYEGLVDDEGRPAKDPGDVADDNALRQAWYHTLRLGL